MQPSVGMRAGEPGAAPPLVEDAAPASKRRELLFRSFGVSPEWCSLPLRESELEAAPLRFPADLHPELLRVLEASGRRGLPVDACETFTRISSGFDVAVSGHGGPRSNLGIELTVLDRATFDRQAATLHLCHGPLAVREASERWCTTGEHFQLPLVVTVIDEKGRFRELGPPARDARGRVLVTSFRGLECGLLPLHHRHPDVFGRLRHVLVDDIEHHRGLLGTRAAYLLHRLQRLTLHHGAAPAFIASAGAAGVDAAAHAERLVGRPFHAVRAEVQGRLPGVVATHRTGRAPSLARDKQSETLTAQLEALLPRLAEACPSILLIASSRSEATRLRRRWADEETAPASQGTFLRVCTAEEAQQLAAGAFDAVVTLAFPGTVSGLWQQLLLARPKTGVALWIPGAAPLERLFARRPLLLLDGTLEEPAFDPIHLPELLRQLPHAACELRIEPNEAFAQVDGEATSRVLERLSDSGHVQLLQGEQSGYGARRASLPPLTYVPERLTPGVAVDRSLTVLLECERRSIPHEGDRPASLSFGEVLVEERSPEERNLRRFQSTAAWLSVGPSVGRALEPGDTRTLGLALQALGNALLPFSALAAMAAADAVGFHHQRLEDGEGLLFLYDRQVGGGGVSGRLFDTAPVLLRQLRHLTDHCPCEDGCGACIGAERGRGLLMALLSELGVGANN